MMQKNDKIRQKQNTLISGESRIGSSMPQTSDLERPDVEELKQRLRQDESHRVALTEKFSFEICADIISYDIYTVLNTMNRNSSADKSKLLADIVYTHFKNERLRH